MLELPRTSPSNLLTITGGTGSQRPTPAHHSAKLSTRKQVLATSHFPVYSERMNPADPPSRKKPAMIGLPPSARGGRPADIAAHASQVAQEWEDVGENYVRKRARELGIPEHMIGQPDYDRDGTRRAFDPLGQQGGGNTTGAIVDSGVLNPELLKGKKGGRIYPRMTVKERIDSTLAHEYEELRAGGKHVEALRAAAKTKLSIMPESRRLCKAMAR
jgi:hypothetical protein